MKFLVLGAGKMGFAVGYDLIRSPRVDEVLIVDNSKTQLLKVAERLLDSKIKTAVVDIADSNQVIKAMNSCDVAISCVPYFYNYELAKAALRAKVSFCDLGGNESIVLQEFRLNEIAEEQGITVIPDLGLAPGLVSIVTTAAAATMDEVYDIRIRVGGVPVEPEGLPMGYSQVFAIEGLVNEYVEDVTIIRDGKISRIPSLTELETIEFPKPFKSMEAFATSGGISTLPQSFVGKVEHLDYKTIRHPGHCEQVKLLKDLGLMDSRELKIGGKSIRPRDVLSALLSEKLPRDEPDAILVRVTVAGTKANKPVETVWECIDFADQASALSAMMRMTAFPASIVAQMIARGDIKEKGVLRQEMCVPIQLFLTELASRGINFTIAEHAQAVRRRGGTREGDRPAILQ